MLRLLVDENFNGDIVRGLLRRLPELDLVRVLDVGLATQEEFSRGLERARFTFHSRDVSPRMNR